MPNKNYSQVAENAVPERVLQNWAQKIQASLKDKSAKEIREIYRQLLDQKRWAFKLSNINRYIRLKARCKILFNYMKRRNIASDVLDELWELHQIERNKKWLGK